MSTTHYRVLFEIIFLHDYYLSQPDESSFFNLADSEQHDFLQTQLQLGHYNVSKDLLIQPTAKTQKLMGNHRMRFVPTSTGFFVGAEINITLNEANQEEFGLIIPLAQPITWEFTVGMKNTDYRNFTNMRFKNPLPVKYLFSNENPGNLKTFPSLASPVADFKEGIFYEMGELALIDGKLNQAIENTSDSTVGWQELTTNHNWISEQDRILLPKLFTYSIKNTGVSEVEFLLKDTDGADILLINTADRTIRKIIASNGDLINVILDFEGIVSGRYELEVSEDGGAAMVFPLFLSDDLYQGAGLGGIVIHSREAGDGSDILTADNTLIRTNDNHPVFEIRFKNRSSYWRYRSQSKIALKAENEALNFLEEFNDDLRTKKPKSLQRLPLQFENGGGKIFLPNPAKLTVKPEADGRLYSEIFVSKVEGLIEIKISD